MDSESMLHSQKIYFCNDEALVEQQTQCLEVLYDYNQTRPSESEKRTEILRRLLGAVGDNCYFEPPLRANWGRHTYVGDNVYANFNLTLVDDTYIYIGNSVKIGENSVIGAGSVVTKDIPSNVVAVGNPCRVLREIGEHDKEFYYKERQITHNMYQR
ncbi:sugar O-acetyltransferase [Vibrio antiquarius]|uniref:maltose acetyltransferase domain-containing protein n=1 Tax=Vibrio diabolicus subgroup TaxID=2315253 RepID=UPI00211B2373|nr:MULTISPECIES: maltose acetyltransferase domain-containing protein [Vibrio diabolicus subgroup]MCG6221526.1 sugar O-acetyltransferase [Vibrio diabolicus]MCR9685594.1 sugar O-acetyltransferase [Vibrio antiquarius]HDU8575748.1 sugar O-acetyltransferase [Vibrio diabolicus]HDU8580303.1 sugar O-acetyltransferase [Vibrio diabolicus]